jgi:hypothetical protein
MLATQLTINTAQSTRKLNHYDSGEVKILVGDQFRIWNFGIGFLDLGISLGCLWLSENGESYPKKLESA